ncbi:MAG: 50S ribosomal protein L19 [Candidatus Babeliales bacterium]
MKANKLTKETIAQLGVVDRGFPEFAVGDTIAVAQKITEGDKERIQIFEGDVICDSKNGISSTFTVRKISANAVAIERIFPVFSPLIDSIKVIRRGDTRRAKLYYIRKRVGKAARVKEKIVSKTAE